MRLLIRGGKSADTRFFRSAVTGKYGVGLDQKKVVGVVPFWRRQLDASLGCHLIIGPKEWFTPNPWTWYCQTTAQTLTHQHNYSRRCLRRRRRKSKALLWFALHSSTRARNIITHLTALFQTTHANTPITSLTQSSACQPFASWHHTLQNMSFDEHRCNLTTEI